jgi:hypothetical protein
MDTPRWIVIGFYLPRSLSLSRLLGVACSRH